MNFVSNIRIGKKTPLFNFLVYFMIRLDVISPSGFHDLSEEIKKFLAFAVYTLDPSKFGVLDEFSFVIIDLVGHDQVLVKNPKFHDYKFGNFFIILRTQLLATLFVLGSDYQLVCGNKHYPYLARWSKKLLTGVEKIGVEDYLLEKENFIISNGMLNKDQFLELVSFLVKKDKPVGKYNLTYLKRWRLLIAHNLNVTTRYKYPVENKKADLSSYQSRKAIIKGIKVLQDHFSVVS